VKSFARRATKGIDCKLLVPETRSQIPARYVLEKDLRELSVKADDSRNDLSYPISQVTEIVRVDEDDSALPPHLVGSLDASTRKKLLVINCRERQLLLVESSPEDAETFFTSMRVLRLYCQQQDYIRAG
jgi:hypothetical protein